MTITRNFKLCLNAGVGLAPYINVNQFDQGEQWVFTLYQEDGTQYTPSTGAIVGIKADHFGIINTGTVVDGKVVINETQQMTAAAGKAIFELQIDGDTHGTANFIVMVEPKPGNNANYSDSDISGIQQAIDAANLINELADAGEEPKQFIIDEVDAWLDNHPEATTTVLDGAITAPKINNSLWDKLLVSEEASGAVASFDDGADDVPVSSLKVALEPIQTGSGDPSPSNIRPIIAANGKNMMPSGVDGTYTKNGITCIAKNGVYKLTGTSTAITDIQIPLTESADLTPTNKKLAFLNTENNGNSLSVDVYRDSTRVHYWTMNSVNRVVSGWTDTGNETINRIVFHVSSGVTVNNTISPMLMLLSDNDYSYQPYQGIMVEKCGKNLLNSAFCANRTNKGITTVLNADGSITLTGTADSSSRYWNASDTLALTLPSGTYTLTPSNMRIEKVGGGYSNGTFTLAEPTTYQNVYFTLTSGTTYNTTVYPQLEVGSEATEYEEYVAPTQYPYSLGQSVYGGTVDLATGVLTVDKVAVDLGTFTWTAQSDAQGQYFRTGLTPQGRVSLTENICTCYAVVPPTNVGDGNIAMGAIGNVMYVRDTRYSDASAFRTGITGQLFVYLLATPTTVQLTPQEVKTLLGYNNISSSGTVEVIYHADTKLYVDKMTNVDNAIIAPTEVDFVATRNYTVNDLVIVNDTLYKVTANIATGSAITPNSNVTQTTLGALIKALS